MPYKKDEWEGARDGREGGEGRGGNVKHIMREKSSKRSLQRSKYIDIVAHLSSEKELRFEAGDMGGMDTKNQTATTAKKP